MPVSKEIQDFIDENEEIFCSQSITLDTSGQSKKFDDKGQQIYVFPSYGWDGGNGISHETINLKQVESLDVYAGPSADVYTKIDSTKEAAIYYSYAGDDEAMVFVV